MRWLLLLLYDPATALDLWDMSRKDKLDHSKVVGIFAFMSLYAVGWYQLLVLERPMTTAEWIILGTLSFGWPAWRTFLRARIARIELEEETKREERWTGKALHPLDDA